MSAPAEQLRDVTVVIPARNAGATLGAQLDALAVQDAECGFEVVVADNGSSDGTADLVRRRAADLPQLRWIDAAGGSGAAYARNIGARNAQGRFVLFCDADDVVDPGWVSALVRGLQNHEIVGGYLDLDLLNDDPEIGWRGRLPVDRLPSDRFLPAGSSANLGVRSEVFQSLGGFDTTISVGAAGEDLDLFWRAGLAGCSVGFVPDAVVHYRLRRGIRANMRQEFTYARALARLWKRYRKRGMERPPLAIAGKRVGWLVLHLPDLVRGPTLRGRWSRGAAAIAGAITGSIENRVLYL